MTWSSDSMPHGAASDADLVVASLAGDRDAFAAIYDRYADRIHDFCCSVLRDRDEAADAMQDTFVIAARRLGQLRDPDRLRAWLYTIARRESLRHARASKRVVPIEDACTERASPGPSPEDAAQENLSRAALTEIVWRAAEGLSPRDRVLLDLHLRQGLEGQELAEAMGVPAGHAYVLMNRLRGQVERSLGALLVVGVGRRDCEELQRVLADWDGRFTPVWRKRVVRHVEQCDLCERTRAGLVSPLSLLGGVPLVAAPVGLREKVLARVDRTNPRRPVTRHRRLVATLGGGLVALLVALAAGWLLTASPHHRLPTSARTTLTTTATTLPTTTTPPRNVVPPTPTTPRTVSLIPAPLPTTTTTAPVPISLPPADLQGPTITGLYAAPLPICISGSTTTTVANANVTDPSGIASVTVTIVAPDGTTTKPMAGPGPYRATIGPFSTPSPPNATWTVHATDRLGNQSDAAGPPIPVLTGC